MSRNHMKSRVIAYFSISLTSLLAFGCALDDVLDRGDRCPPSDINESISYIQMGSSSTCKKGDGCYTEVFNSGDCPKNFDGCYLDSKEAFYCMAKCPKGQIACDGSCINPDTDMNYCGASDSCDGSGYGCCESGKKCDWWETCQNGRCADTVCTDGKMRCKDGVSYICNNKSWEVEEKCKSNSCNSDNTACSDTMVCSFEGKDLSEGKKACSSDKKELVICRAGNVEAVDTCSEKELCMMIDGDYKCAVPEYQSCQLNETVVLHETAICDGNRLRTCYDGKLDGGQTCPLPNDPEKTVCFENKCVVPEGCMAGEVSIAHKGRICDGAVVKECYNKDFSVVLDCSTRSDNKIYCRDNDCVVPNTCQINGKTVKHGDVTCGDNNSQVKCVDGVSEVVNECGKNATCSEEGCVPKYRTIKAIHVDYDKYVNLESCSETGDASKSADVVVEGVVTAMNGTSGFFIQEVSADGKQAGAYVSCPKNKKCTTYADGSAMALGDNVRVTSTGLNSYYCQLQIYDPAKDVVVEKTAGTAKIEPAVISGADILDNGAESASNIYDGMLVRISPLTVQDVVAELIGGKNSEIGWSSLDENAKGVLIGNMLTKQKPLELANGHHYDVTGVVYYSYNHLQIVPRNSEDVSEVTECGEGETAVKCMKLAGNDRLVSCKDGRVDEESSKNCTKDNKVCDSKLSSCREPVICSDSTDSPIEEGMSGCSTETELSVCGYDAGTEKAVWVNSQTCADGCNAEKSECFAAAIKACTFVSLDPETHKGIVDVEVPAGSKVSVEIRCTKYADCKTTYVNKWPNAENAVVNESCSDCTTQTQYVSAGTELATEEDKYVCVAIATVENGKSYICPSDASTGPFEYSRTTKLNNDEVTSSTLSYSVSKPVLAYWTFDDKTMNIDSSSIKKDSTFKLANSNGKIEYMDDSSVASQAGWSRASEPDFTKDPYWQVVINTRGYSNITFSYVTKASSSNPKSFQVAYKVGYLDFRPVGNVLKFSDNGGSWKSWKEELPQADDSDTVTIGIFPFATSDPKIRIDEVRVTGDAK